LKRAHISFPSGELTLEGVWHFPEGEGPFPAVIVCHPHPLYGGNMSSNVVFNICQALALNNIAALRFNFRGVGKSEGDFGGGTDEQEDVRAALDFALSEETVDPERVGLAGYSFGGGVAAAVAVRDERIKSLALVSPAFMYGGEELREYLKPKFIIIGEEDSMVAPEGVAKEVEKMPEPKQFKIIPGADHFWGGFEEEVAEKVTGFFAEGLGGAGTG
jgi:alpha/beta superfamily hydrolase